MTDSIVCILCGSPSPQKELYLEGIFALDKFRQQLNRFSSISSGDLLSGGTTPAFCEECLCDVTLAGENGEEVVRVEGEVRRLQQELLRQMHQLCTVLDIYLKGMGRIEGKVQRDNKSRGCGWTSGNAVQFRTAIIKVVQELSYYRTNLMPKLLIPQSPSQPIITADLSDFIPSPSFQEAAAAPVKTEGAVLSEDEDFLETEYPETTEADDPLSSEMDYGKSSPGNTAESEPESATEDETPNNPATEVPSSNTIILKREKFVPNDKELSKIKDPVKRGIALVKQRDKWQKQQKECPICWAECARSTFNSHLKKLHGLTVVFEGEDKKRVKASKPVLEKKKKETKKDKELNCPECGKKMGRLRTLRNHLWKAHKIYKEFGGVLVGCELCQVKIGKAGIVEHLQGHVGAEYVIHCPNSESCTYACVTPFRMRQHLESQTNCQGKGNCNDFESASTCQECGEVCRNPTSLRSHLLQLHETVEKGFPCPISGCGQSFTFRQSVVLHLPQHDIPRRVEVQSCSQCKEQVNLEEMAVHLREKHGVEEIIKCSHCPFQFGHRENLVDHLYNHRHSQSLSCDICGVEKVAVFDRYNALADHYFREHQIGTRWSCNQCPSVFWKAAYLSNHIRENHKETPIPLAKKKETYQCEDCGQELGTKQSLRSHQIRFHGATPFGCHFCSETFSNMPKLLAHEKEVHKGVPIIKKEFPCAEPGCGAILTTQRSLRNHHSAVHLKEPGTHVCDQCGKVFRAANQLRKHRNVVHLKLRNHVCEECGEAFGHRKVLQRHMLIHTGERPFACDICGQPFRTKEALKIHLEGHARKGADFKPTGPMKQIRKRVEKK